MSEEVADLFHALADLPADERASYFDSHATPPALRAEVEALLAFDGQDPATVMRHEIRILASEAVHAHDRAEGRRFEQLRCGPFRLREVIGRGGMGVVYLGERDDGEVTQRAAVKLPRGALLDGRARVRFLQERQILAAMSHPNVARLLDAGHLDDGQPYLAMEFIEGKTIDRYAEGLAIRDKLELIIKVAGAVSYLHRNLVVHRDLKPGNILVTSDGEPKILDFGIAKVVDLAHDVTMTGHRLLTPGFASPEQMLGETIGTTTDVYSLAAVLYFLLTGRTPVEGSAAGAVTRPAKWASGIDTDIEIVLMKALRREPAERYGTADAFAEDLRAFLDSRPVSARKGDWVYRARKVARRYWLPAGAVALMIAGLSTGLIIATRQRQLAERRFNDVRQLSARLFDIDDIVRRLPNSAEARQLIVNTSLEYLGRLRADAASNPGLALELGTAYMRVAQVQGIPLSPNLGQTKNAAENLAIAEDLLEAVQRAQPANRAAMLRRAEIVHDRMSLAENDPTGEPMPLARSAEAWLRKYIESGPVDGTNASLAISIGTNIANRYQMQEENGEAIRLLRSLKDLAAATGATDQTGSLRIVLARIQRRTGDLDAALATIRETTRGEPAPLMDKTSVNLVRRYRLALAVEGAILFSTHGASLGLAREALEPLEKAARIGEELVARNPNDALIRMAVSTDLYRLADALNGSDPERAIALLESAAVTLDRVEDNKRSIREQVKCRAAAAEALVRLGRKDAARRHLDSAFSLLGKLGTYPAKRIELCEEACLTLRARGRFESETGRLAEAAGTFRELLAAFQDADAKPERSLDQSLDYAEIQSALAGVLDRSGDAAGSAEMLARRNALWREWERKLPGNGFVRRQLSGQP